MVPRARYRQAVAEARELVAGFWLWEDEDEDVAWAKRCPNPMSGPSEIEIRPFFEEIHAYPQLGGKGLLLARADACNRKH